MSSTAQPSPDVGHGPVQDIVRRLADASDTDCVRLGDVLDAFGSKSFLPVLMVPALLVVSPLSGIPFFSSICGITIVFISAQMVASREHLWLPEFVTEREIEGERARSAVARLGRVARWLDRNASGRLGWLMRAPMRKWAQVLCLICGAAMPILELVPFSSSILGVAVLLLSTSLLARDGLFMVLGIGVMGVAAIVPFFAISAVSGS